MSLPPPLIRADAAVRNGRPTAPADPAAWPADPAERVAGGFVPPPTEAEAVGQYRRLVFKYARYYARMIHPWQDREGLVTVGQMAVVTAHRRWRPDGGSMFLTYLATLVPRAMWRHVAVERRGGLSRLSGARPGRASLDGTAVVSRTPDRNTLMARVEAEIRRRAGGESWAFAPEEWADIYRQLSPRQADVLRRRLHGESLRLIAADLGVTGERIRQIERDTIRKLRNLAGQVPCLRDNIPVPKE